MSFQPSLPKKKKGFAAAFESITAMANTVTGHPSLSTECIRYAQVLEDFIPSVIPQTVINSAQGIVILTVLKVGFGASGRLGHGLMLGRLPNGSWSTPTAISLAGAGYGFQAGASITDIVFVLNTRETISTFCNKGGLTLGGQFQIAVGPGTTSEAQATVNKHGVNPIFTYTKTQGVFAGVSLEGSGFITRNDLNNAWYGEGVKPKMCLSGDIPPSEAADPLYRALVGIRPAVLPHHHQYKQTTKPQVYPTVSQHQSPPPNVPLQHTPTWSSEHQPAVPSAQPPPNYTPSEATQVSNLEPKLANELNYTSPAVTSTQTLNSQPSALSTSATKKAAYQEIMDRYVLTGKEVEVEALFDFMATQSSDLQFKRGDIITVIDKKDDVNSWWIGQLGDKRGLFPANYCRLLSTDAPERNDVTVMKVETPVSSQPYNPLLDLSDAKSVKSQIENISQQVAINVTKPTSTISSNDNAYIPSDSAGGLHEQFIPPSATSIATTETGTMISKFSQIDVSEDAATRVAKYRMMGDHRVYRSTVEPPNRSQLHQEALEAYLAGLSVAEKDLSPLNPSRLGIILSLSQLYELMNDKLKGVQLIEKALESGKNIETSSLPYNDRSESVVMRELLKTRLVEWKTELGIPVPAEEEKLDVVDDGSKLQRTDTFNPGFQPFLVEALYEFQARSETELGFKKGDQILVEKGGGDQDSWWIGRIGENVGEFPANFVKIV
ncbi:hypothetical protein HK098_005040 [Nowakowskiella sp. JEL0407]|nr:hypothetical protein HK098_005040 [Nowakowskiella sp. JEL0407]